MKQLLKQLSEPCSVTGHHRRISEQIRKLMIPYCDSAEIDEFGNVIGIKYGSSGKTVLVDAHIDEIGLQVKEICENGSLSFIAVGGIDPRILPCSEVIVHGKKDCYGVIGAKPPHLLTAEDEKKTLQLSDMRIDIGMERPEAYVRVGDAVSFRPVFRELGQDRIVCKGLDNKCGTAIMLYAMQHLQSCPHTLIFCASTSEELDCFGAKAVAERFDVNASIVTDVTFGMTPGEDEALCRPLGSGVAICTGPCIHRGMFQKACDIAQRNRIPYTLEAEGGVTGTNADVIQISNRSVPTLLLSVPIRYMHTMTEMLQLSDMKAAAELMISMVGGDAIC